MRDPDDFPESFAVIESSLPPSMTLPEWRHARPHERPARLVRALRHFDYHNWHIIPR